MSGWLSRCVEGWEIEGLEKLPIVCLLVDMSVYVSVHVTVSSVCVRVSVSAYLNVSRAQ